MTARNMCIVALLALAGCDQASRELGSKNYDVIQSGKVGTGRYATYVMVVRDRSTGCEYLASGYQDLSMTPRMAADGKQICRGAA